MCGSGTPAMDRDYADPQTVEFALKEWGDLFKKLPRVDAVFVPGGDPGHTRPKVLMDFLAKQTENLHRLFMPRRRCGFHRRSFNQSWLDEFIGILQSEQPNWLSGVVYGPQIRVSLPQLRAAVPRKYPIRHYPDITHCWRANTRSLTGTRLTQRLRARADQSASARPGDDIPAHATRHHRVSDLLGRLQ